MAEPTWNERALDVVWGGVLVCAALLALFPCQSDDIFMYLAIGRRAITTGAFPHVDPWLFSLSNHHPGFETAWASHLLAYLLYVGGGFSALVIAKTGLVLVAAAAPFLLAHRLGVRSLVAPLLLLFALFIASDRFLERTSLVTDVLSAVVLALALWERTAPSRWRWLLPPLFVVWTNLHPGVFLGLFLLGAVAVSQPREWRRWGGLLLACVVAAGIHPQGFAHLATVLPGLFSSDSSARQYYFEFMPTLGPVYRFNVRVDLFLVLLLVSFGLWIRAFRRGAPVWHALVCLCGLSLVGLWAVRFVATAALALAVLDVELLAAARALTPEGSASSRPSPRRQLAIRTATAVLVFGFALKLAVFGYASSGAERRLGLGLDRRLYPFAAAAFVRSLGLSGNVFNEHGFGAFLAWEWDGEPKLFYHGFVEDAPFYLRNYIGAAQSPKEFRRVVDEYRIGAFFLGMIPPPPAPMPAFHQLLLHLPDWRLVFQDERAMVFLHDVPENRALIERHEYRYYDVLRPERIQAALREHPRELLDEALRVLRTSPDTRPARDLIRQLYHLDPDELLRESGGAGGPDGATP